ncbi:MAG TPA: DUF2917 domain-containing protein [Anaeromyxobacteraceae bacterium]|nr:DUF2917 domain-containing protein [Anaeromyxobacteraceae bacterium]
MMTKHLTRSEAWSTEVHHAGTEVRVLAGTVWVTQEADPEDHVLVAPATFTTRRHGRIAMEALTAADVQVDGVAPRGLSAAA